MTTSKGLAWLATSAAVLALSYSAYEYTVLQSQRDQNHWLAQERDSLKNALQQSEQRALEEHRRRDFAEQQVADLRREAEKLSAAKPTLPTTTTRPAPAITARQSDADRMREMKPLLESGMPISGAVVVMVQGKPVQKHVDLVMGKETQIEGADDGTYAITPTLNADGSVKYGIVITKKDPTSGIVTIGRVSDIIQTPWGQFTLHVDNGAIIAFDPDNSSP